MLKRTCASRRPADTYIWNPHPKDLRGPYRDNLEYDDTDRRVVGNHADFKHALIGNAALAIARSAIQPPDENPSLREAAHEYGLLSQPWASIQ